MRHLTQFEKDELLRFFLYHMKAEQRGLLMATYPLHYKMLYPTVSKETLAFQAANRIEWMQENSKNLMPDRGPKL